MRFDVETGHFNFESAMKYSISIILNKVRKLRLITKICFMAFVAMLWLIVIGLTLEIISYYNWQRILAGNDWIQECEATEYLQEKNIRQIPLPNITNRLILPPRNLDQTIFPVGSISPSRPFETAEERMTRYSIFDSLPIALRDNQALLNFECVLDFDRSGKVLQEYGGFKLLQLNHLDAYIQTNLFQSLSPPARDMLTTAMASWNSGDDASKRQELDIPPDLHATILPLQASVDEASADFRVFLRAIEHPAIMPWLPEELPEDTPWAIPFYRYKPNMRQQRSVMADAIDTDDLGFRTAPVEKPKPKNIYRILCFGGSTTEEGNTDLATYPAVLQRLLREYIGNDNIEVVNAGVCSSTTNTHAAATADFLTYEPDLVLGYEGTNELVAYLVFHGPKVRNSAQALGNYSTHIRRNYPGILYPSATNLKKFLNYYTFRQLEAMRTLFENHGAQMMLCSLDGPDLELCTKKEMEYFDYSLARLEQASNRYSFWESLLNEYNAELREWCEASGVGYLPLAENLSAGSEVYPDICHMYDGGIALKAHIIFELIKDWIKGEMGRKSLLPNPEALLSVG